MTIIAFITYLIFCIVLGVCPKFTVKKYMDWHDYGLSSLLSLGYYYPKINQVEICLDSCKKTKKPILFLVTTIIHELRHAWQMKQGFTKFDSVSILNDEECEEDAISYSLKWFPKFREQFYSSFVGYK